MEWADVLVFKTISLLVLCTPFNAHPQVSMLEDRGCGVYVSMLEDRGCGAYVSMLEDRGCGVYVSMLVGLTDGSTNDSSKRWVLRLSDQETS